MRYLAETLEKLLLVVDAFSFACSISMFKYVCDVHFFFFFKKKKRKDKKRKRKTCNFFEF